MNDKPETTFEFDPLPGDEAAPKEPPDSSSNPASKTKKKDATKPAARKKRGPRRVAPQQQITGISIADTTGSWVATAAVKPARKKREPKADLAPEFGYIKQFMAMSEPTRKRVLAVLNKVFG